MKRAPVREAAVNPYQRFIEGKDPLKVLGATHRQLLKLIDGLSPRQLRVRPAPDKWSIEEIIAHIADCEHIYSVRCRLMAFENNPPLTPFDQDAWADGRVREREPLNEMLERFDVLRKSQLRLFKNLTEDDLSRTGVHAEFGQISLGLYMAWAAGHDLNHLTQIAGIRGSIRGPRS